MPRIDMERDSPFLPAHPHQLIKSKSFNHVPYITGLNQNEGAMMVASMRFWDMFVRTLFNWDYISVLLAGNGTMMETFKKDPEDYFLHDLMLEKSENGRQIVEKILELFDKEKPFDQQLETIEHVIDRKSAIQFCHITEQLNSTSKFSSD